MTAAVIATLALFLVAVAWIYNRLVADRNQARQGFADIDVQLKRRADLVPQLVEAVRGYAAYEKALLTSVTELRASAAGAGLLAERFSHERALGESLKKLLLLQESYPQLKADANFRKLADELVEVEDHLQYARRFYKRRSAAVRDAHRDLPRPGRGEAVPLPADALLPHRRAGGVRVSF